MPVPLTGRELIMNLKGTASLIVLALGLRAGITEMAGLGIVHRAANIQAQPSSPAEPPSLRSEALSLSPGWNVKYLRPRQCPPSCSGEAFRVQTDEDRVLPRLKLERADARTAGQTFVMTDEREDDSLYIVYWKSPRGLQSELPADCEYIIEAIRE